MMEQGRPTSLYEALAALRLASEIPAKQRSIKASDVVDSICDHAYRDGLGTESIQSVVGIITRKTELDQTSSTNLIKNLYPSGRVSSETVVTLVDALGQGERKPSSSTQSALLRWLGNVYAVLEETAALSRLYGVLFGLLDMSTLRPALCHLLLLITRRKNVRPFRIQYLLELSRIAGAEPALAALLRLYKDFYPDIIVGSLPSARTSLFSRTDKEWRDHLQRLQASSVGRADYRVEHGNGYRVLRQGAKRSKVSVVPEVHTLHGDESSVLLEDIDGVESFVANLERLEPPNQMIACLQDPLSQKYCVLSSDEDASRRLALWLSRFFSDELEDLRNGSRLSAALSEVLLSLLGFIRATKASIPILDAFLAKYILIWDGASDVDTIIGLLSQCSSQQYQDAYENLFRPAEAAMMAQGPAGYKKLLTLYTHVFHAWSTSASPRHMALSSRAGVHSEDITALVEHVNMLAQSALSSGQASSSTMSAILSFYELASVTTNDSIKSRSNLLRVILPPSEVIYLLMFSCSSNDFSRLCGILATYKQAFEESMRSTDQPDQVKNRFNGYMMDTCNLLWRSRALRTSEQNTFGCLCPEKSRDLLHTYLTQVDRDYSLWSSFGLAHHHLLCAQGAAVLRELEDKAEADGRHLAVRHHGEATLKSLAQLEKDGGISVSWRDYRVSMLDWLEQHGLGGNKALLSSAMKDLKSR